MTRRATLAAALLALATGPGRADDLTRRQKGDLAIQARAILRVRCGECHGTDHAAAAARTGFSVLDHKALVTADPARGGFTLVSKDAPAAAHLLGLIECGTMPPGGRPRPTDAELDVLRKWAAAGAPSYPEAFDDATTLRVMLDDLDAHKADAPHLRYLSLAHLVRDDAPPPDLKAAEFKLASALVATTRGGAPPPEPVDDTATLFRLDLQKVRWDVPNLFQTADPGRAPAAYPMTPYDLILLDYPHGFAVPEDAPHGKRLKAYLDAARQVRPVAFVRADWLSDVLAAEEPLATDMEAIMQLVDAKSVNKPAPRGRRPEPFAGAKPLALPAFADGRRPLPPFGAAYAADVATAPAPFKFTAAVTVNQKPVDAVKVNARFKIAVSADREVYVLVLNVTPDGQIRPLLIDGGPLLKPDAPRDLRPEGDAAFVIGGIDGGEPEAVEHYVVLASEFEITPKHLSVVRSVHPDYDPKFGRGPVWRVAFTPEAAGVPADKPAKVVRKVLPLKVTRN